jgi:RimJ/RimL family protein N-acetyltransferase
MLAPVAGRHSPSPSFSRNVAPLSAGDLAHFHHHLLRLSRNCRRSRFGNEVKDTFLGEYVDRIDLTNTAVLGYFDDGEMRAAVEIRSLQDVWCAEAEVAFSVEESLRGRGVGTLLMRSALSAARHLGIKHLHLICDRRNRPMQRIAEAFGAEMTFQDDDCIAHIQVGSVAASLDRAAA